MSEKSERILGYVDKALELGVKHICGHFIHPIEDSACLLGMALIGKYESIEIARDIDNKKYDIEGYYQPFVIAHELYAKELGITFEQATIITDLNENSFEEAREFVVQLG